MKRYVAAEIRRVAAKSTHTERHWKRFFYYAKSGRARGRLAVEVKTRWALRLKNNWRHGAAVAAVVVFE